MSTKVQATAKRMTADELRQLLGPAAKDAVVEDSALEMMQYIDPRAVAAIGEALREVEVPALSRIFGTADPEDRDWSQVWFAIRGAGDFQVDEWRRVLNTTSEVIDRASRTHAEVLNSAWSQVGFWMMERQECSTHSNGTG